MTEQGKCKDCKFYREGERVHLVFSAFGPPRDYTVIERLCWRHPEHVNVRRDHWCGDYEANDKGE
jgi:hypothetical protein